MSFAGSEWRYWLPAEIGLCLSSELNPKLCTVHLCAPERGETMWQSNILHSNIGLGLWPLNPEFSALTIYDSTDDGFWSSWYWRLAGWWLVSDDGVRHLWVSHSATIPVYETAGWHLDQHHSRASNSLRTSGSFNRMLRPIWISAPIWFHHLPLCH